MNHHLGVCSWSLQTERVETLVELIAEVGVRSVQLGLDPLVAGEWSVDGVREVCSAAGIEIRSGMLGMRGEDYTTPATIRRTGGIRPGEHWAANLQAATKGAQIAHSLGLDLVSFHAGYLPHDAADPERATLVRRLGELVDVFAAQGVRVALETGQEQAATLLEILNELERPTLGVNFDSANMLLYGMGDPLDALRMLAPHVFQVHIKDATSSGDPEVWGAEVPVGTGEVRWSEFFEVLHAAGCGVDLMIEREAGDSRVRDMQTARELLEGLDVLEAVR